MAEDLEKRVASAEKTIEWLQERVWTGTGNLHERVHTLEDRRVSEEIDRSAIKEDIKKIEQILGINGSYGTRNIISDLRDALDTIDKLKEGVITLKDFQSLIHKVDNLEKRDQAKLTFQNVIQISIVTTAISIVIQFLASKIIP